MEEGWPKSPQAESSAILSNQGPAGEKTPTTNEHGIPRVVPPPVPYMTLKESYYAVTNS